jgi:hypothetical protein
LSWSVGSQPLLVDFQAGVLVEDAGLLAVRQLDVSLGVLVADRLWALAKSWLHQRLHQA